MKRLFTKLIQLLSDCDGMCEHCGIKKYCASKISQQGTKYNNKSIIFMELNLSKLHTYYNNPVTSIAVGKTTAVCYQALGFADVMDDIETEIVIISDSPKHVFNTLVECTQQYNGSEPESVEKTGKSRFIANIPFFNNPTQYRLVKVICVTYEQYMNYHYRGTSDQFLLFDFMNGVNSINTDSEIMYQALMKMLVAPAVNEFYKAFGGETLKLIYNETRNSSKTQT